VWNWEQGLAHGGGDRRPWPGELGERLAEAVAQARAREPRPQTLGGAIEAIGEDPFDPVRRLLLGCGALKLSIGLGEGGGTSVLGVAQVPDDTTMDNRGQRHLVGETVTMLLISEEIHRQGQTTSDHARHYTLLAEGADQALEGHRRDRADHRAQLQTQAAMGGQQGIASDLGSHLAVT
jgi:hypothetical protein